MFGGIIPVFSRGNQGSKNFTETLRSVGKSLEAGFRMSVALRAHILTTGELIETQILGPTAGQLPQKVRVGPGGLWFKKPSRRCSRALKFKKCYHMPGYPSSKKKPDNLHMEKGHFEERRCEGGVKGDTVGC